MAYTFAQLAIEDDDDSALVICNNVQVGMCLCTIPCAGILFVLLGPTLLCIRWLVVGYHVQLPSPKNAAYRVIRAIFLACLSTVAIAENRRMNAADMKVGGALCSSACRGFDRTRYPVDCTVCNDGACNGES